MEALVLSTSRPEIYRRLTATTDRLAALDEWVQRGGRLVISAGSQAAEPFSENGVLERFAPGKLLGIEPVSQTSDLEAFAEVQEPLPVARSGAAKPRWPALTPRQIRGVIQAPDNYRADLPLVIRTPYGLGEVVFVTVDLDQPPFVDWKARGNFVNKLLGKSARGSEASSERSSGGQVTTTGLTDLVGQLRGALDQFVGVKLVPFSLVALLVVGYILLIGPVDYFLPSAIG